MAKTRTENLQRWRQKLLSRFPESARRFMRDANDKTADEFMAKVRQIIPKGDDVAPELEDTLRKREGDPAFGGLGVIVSIGGPEAPYPMSLEAGHKAPDGSHVPARPFWNPARRVLNKRHKARAARAQRKAVQSIAGST